MLPKPKPFSTQSPSSSSLRHSYPLPYSNRVGGSLVRSYGDDGTRMVGTRTRIVQDGRLLCFYHRTNSRSCSPDYAQRRYHGRACSQGHAVEALPDFNHQEIQWKLGSRTSPRRYRVQSTQIGESHDSRRRSISTTGNRTTPHGLRRVRCDHSHSLRPEARRI